MLAPRKRARVTPGHNQLRGHGALNKNCLCFVASFLGLKDRAAYLHTCKPVRNALHANKNSFPPFVSAVNRTVVENLPMGVPLCVSHRALFSEFPNRIVRGILTSTETYWHFFDHPSLDA